MQSEFLRRVEATLKKKVQSFTTVVSGYTPAQRWIVSLNDGRSAFVKIGVTENTANWLRDECDVYNRLKGNFLPEMLGWDDDGKNPILIIEDLSHHHWPPVWTTKMIEEVRKTLDELHSIRNFFRSYNEVFGKEEPYWQTVAKDPKPFLSLNLVSEQWLASHIELLIQLEDNCPTAGDSLCHWDVRSDNICVTNRGVKLVDWNFACLSNPQLDIGFWLPSLEAEGGGLPEQILPNSPDVAVFICGCFASRAGLPHIPEAPRVRSIQLIQLKPAMRWMIRALDLTREGVTI